MEISKMKNEIAKLNGNQRQELAKADTPELFQKFIASGENLFHGMASETSPEDLQNVFLGNFKEMKDFIYKTVFKGDILSFKRKEDDHTEFVKGVMTDEKKDSWVISHYTKGEMEIPKEGSIKFFPGQKYDIRELDDALKLKVDQSTVKININELSPADRIKLLKGEETSGLELSVLLNDKKLNSEKIRLVIKKKDNAVTLNTIKASQSMIYNRSFSKEEIEKIREEPQKHQFSTADGKTYERIVFWDNDLEGIRSRNTENKKEKNQFGKSESTQKNKAAKMKI